ncbi:MAG: hypothetical protein PHN57_01425, partial [Candidatus Omnitrophica bacterium]|nr:hypothetical protein [Candidatus Omnitrophota bacterium]
MTLCVFFVTLNLIMLKVEKVTKSFLSPLSLNRISGMGFSRQNPVLALDNVSFSLGKANILTVLGPNGVGKTT